MSRVEIVEGADAQAIAEWLDDRLSAANYHCEDQFALTIPGGSTPFPILEALTRFDPGPPWSVMRIWPNDDRIVGEDHAASNIGRIRSVLKYAGAEINALSQSAPPPAFALTWLGMGADGHVASLFPNTDPQIDDPLPVRRLTPDPLPPEAPFDRITLTIPALLDTERVVLTLGGSAKKRAVFEAALAGGNDLPVARLLREAGRRGIPVTCFT
ncbi:MAG: 6-phosphogluconolactonase [Erythrobacter sp.]|uniref:6-phosphogluconolactonase n=1 Tax=Erythrobacter sp. TaxID=1042 RepID=UPI0032F08C07